MESSRDCSFCEKKHSKNQHFPYCSSACCTKANRKDSGQLVEPTETKTPMVCFCCGDEFIIEHNFPGMNPEKIRFCSFYCTAKGGEPLPRDKYKTITVKKEEKAGEEKEEFEDDMLLW